MINFDKFPDYRRRAYADAMMAKIEKDNVIGTFGTGLDIAFLYAYGLKPVPIVGIDKFIFKYGDYPGCDPIRSTIIYLKTEKCPLLYSSKMYLVTKVCPKMEAALRANTSKKVVLFEDKNSLGKILNDVYKFSFNQDTYNEAFYKLKKQREYLEELKKSNLTLKQYFQVSFFINYIFDLDERIEVLEEVKSQVKFTGESSRPTYFSPCPGGIYLKVANEFNPGTILLEGNKSDVTCENCIYDARKKFNY